MMTLRSAGILFLLPSLFLLPASPARSGAPPSVRTVALAGDAADGIPGDEHFEWFGGIPGTGIRPPWAGQNGDVGFAAGWMEAINTHGIWRERIGSLELIAAVGDSAPGTDAVWNGFPIFFPASPLVDGPNASFRGTIPGLPSEGGVWIQRGEQIDLVFRQNDPPPGAPDSTHWFDWVHATEGGSVVVNGRYSVAGVPYPQGFWRDRTGDLVPVISSGDPAPGTDPGVVFGNATATALLVFQSWDLDSNGLIAFHAQIQGPGITETDDEGIWMETEEGLQLVVLEGDPAPGLGSPSARFLGNSGFRTFDHDNVIGVFRNNAGHIMFGARVDVPGADNVANVIYTTRSGDLEPIVLGRYPGSNPPGDHAPGFPEDATFARFVFAAFKDDDQIAFSAGVADPDSASSIDLAYGIWTDRGSGIEPVVKDGDPVPGASGLTFYQPVNGPFLADGTLVFQSHLSDGSGPALFIADPDGTIHTIARPGTAFQSPGMDGPKVVTTVTAGAGTAEAVAWPFILFFTDGSSGVYSVAPGSTTGIGSGPLAAGANLHLAPPTPNPFYGETSIRFRLGQAAPLNIKVYDTLGRAVRTLVNGRVGAGDHELVWDGTSRGGRPVGAGVYFIRARGGNVEAVRKIVLAK